MHSATLFWDLLKMQCRKLCWRRILLKESCLIQHASFNLVAFSMAKMLATCNHFQRKSIPHHIAKMKIPAVAQS